MNSPPESQTTEDTNRNEGTASLSTSRLTFVPEEILGITSAHFRNIVGFNDHYISLALGINIIVEPFNRSFGEALLLVTNSEITPIAIFTNPLEGGSSSITFDVAGKDDTGLHQVYPYMFKRQFKANGTVVYFMTANDGKLTKTTPETFASTLKELLHNRRQQRATLQQIDHNLGGYFASPPQGNYIVYDRQFDNLPSPYEILYLITIVPTIFRQSDLQVIYTTTRNLAEWQHAEEINLIQV